MRELETTKAVGHILCHDITQIIRGEKKGVLFKKGHVITEEDIPKLLSVGKDHIFIWESGQDKIHENEAADILCALCKNDFMSQTPVSEGKIELVAEVDGLLKVNKEAIKRVNMIGEIMIATRHGNSIVKKGDTLAGTRIIPLVIEKEKMELAKVAAGEKPLLEIKPLKQKKVGLITTGNEVFYGRIKDNFSPVIIEKLAEFNAQIIEHKILNDDTSKITAAILEVIDKGAEIVLCTGGMSVDPDDRTPLAIKNTGAKIITYGTPILPGAMALISYFDNEIPIIGLPGCVMYAKRTIFDLILPRILSDDLITSEELADLGCGGLCLNCPVCYFPNCGFGKGGY